MIADWQTNKVYLSGKLGEKLPRTYEKIVEKLKVSNYKPTLLPNTNDIWARDYMPIQVDEDKFIEFRYDPDYLQGIEKERRELKTYPDIVCYDIDLYTTKTDLILDGGNVVKASDKIILTDKIIKENKWTYSKIQLLDKLHELFEVDKVILIPKDPECEFGHADGMLRFINDDAVLISGFYLTADNDLREKIIRSLKRNKIDIEWLKCSKKKDSARSIYYINFLQTKDIILLPKLNIKTQDNEALAQIKKYYPEYSRKNRIFLIDVNKIMNRGGALNCISWTIKSSK